MQLLKGLFRRTEPSSGEMAKERLRSVLVQDRAGTSPQLVETMREEVLRAISRHAEIDANNARLVIAADGTTVSLEAKVPIRSLKRRNPTPPATGSTSRHPGRRNR
ncbi:MAG: cell division topological specificity factor MinE [Armatimonadota bacterium]|nr:cell division topological specificity factor MinE [Armatimonadota bacterium]